MTEEGRSPRWPAVRRAFLAAHPACEGCGSRHDLEAHHVRPFHLWPEAELDPANLMALCRVCHFVFGHLHDWASYNPAARADAAAHRTRVANRPAGIRSGVLPHLRGALRMPVPTVQLTGSALTGLVRPESFAIYTVPVDPVMVKLGRRSDPLRVAYARAMGVRLSDYLDLGVLAGSLPDKVDWAAKAQASISRMYLNDKYGDCVIAGKYHAHGVWTGNDANAVAVGTDQEVYQTYQSWCGPGDNGCVITEVLDYCKSQGIPMNGTRHTIAGYADCDHTNKDLVKAAIYLFGCLSLGINLPEDWTDNAVWDVTNSRVVGGHDVTTIGYDATGVQISSWGKVYTITWAAFTSKKWLEECWVLLSEDWTNADKKAPNGVDLATLQADLQKIGGGTVPPVDPVPPGPTPPPGPNPNTSYVWLKLPQVPVVDAAGRVTGHTKFGEYACTVRPRDLAEPVPAPEPIMPQTVTVELPRQPIKVLGLKVASVPYQLLHGVVDGAAAEAMPAGNHLDWLLPILRKLCVIAPNLPAPYNHLAEFLCGLLPADGGKMKALPPVVLTILQELCRFAPYLGNPYRSILMFLCGILPPAVKGPCGCQ